MNNQSCDRALDQVNGFKECGIVSKTGKPKVTNANVNYLRSGKVSARADCPAEEKPPDLLTSTD